MHVVALDGSGVPGASLGVRRAWGRLGALAHRVRNVEAEFGAETNSKNGRRRTWSIDTVRSEWLRRVLHQGVADYGPFPPSPIEGTLERRRLGIRVLGETDLPADIRSGVAR